MNIIEFLFTGPDPKKEERKLAAEREKAAQEEQKRIQQAVNDYQSSSAERIHRETLELENGKQEEKEAIRRQARQKMAEIHKAGTLRKEQMANQAMEAQKKILQDLDNEKKAMQKEREDRAKEDNKRSDLLKNYEYAATNEIEKTKRKDMNQKIDESKKTEGMRDRLAEAKKELDSIMDNESFEFRRRDLEAHLELERQALDATENHFTKISKQKLEIYKTTISSQKQLLDVEIGRSKNEYIKEVDIEITAAKNQVENIAETFRGVLLMLGHGMDENTKSVANDKLVIVNNELSILINSLNVMERKSRKLPDKETRVTLGHQITDVKKDINKAKGCVIELLRDLQPAGHYHKTNRDYLINSIDIVVEKFNKIDHLASGEDAVRRTIGNCRQTCAGSVHGAIEEDPEEH